MPNDGGLPPTSRFTRVASNSAFLRRERPLAKANELNVLFPNDYVAEINPDPKTHQGGVGLHGLTAGGNRIRLTCARTPSVNRRPLPPKEKSVERSLDAKGKAWATGRERSQAMLPFTRAGT